MVSQSNLDVELMAIGEYIKNLIKLEAEAITKKAIEDCTKDVLSRVRVITSSDLNGRFEWYILPKETK